MYYLQPAEKNRFPQTISLFFPHAFEIACFDAFISFMICHCTFYVWKVILSLVLRVSWSIKQHHLHLWLIIFFILIWMFQSYTYIDIIRRNVNLIRYLEFLPIQKSIFSISSVEIVFYPSYFCTLYEPYCFLTISISPYVITLVENMEILWVYFSKIALILNTRRVIHCVCYFSCVIWVYKTFKLES